MVVTLTGGERGDILNPAMDLPEVRGRIADIRRDEMAKAAEILGVEHQWLGFVDSGLPEGDPPPPLPDGCFALVPLEEPVAELVQGDPRVPPARHDHLRRERRLPAPGPHPLPPGVGRRLRGRRRLPAVSRGGRAVERQQALLQPRLPAARLQLLQDEFAKHGQEGPFAKWLENWDPEIDIHRRAGDHPGAVLGVLPPARRSAQGARHPDRPQTDSSSRPP